MDGMEKQEWMYIGNVAFYLFICFADIFFLAQ